MSHRLARITVIAGAVIFLQMFFWMLGQPLEKQEGETSFEYDIRLVTLSLFGFGWCVGVCYLAVGSAQMRWRVFSSRQLEIIVIFCIAMLIVGAPFAGPELPAAMLGKKGFDSRVMGPDDCREVFTYLLIDCLVTVASMMPMRFSSMWGVYPLAALTYPLLQFIFVGPIQYRMGYLALLGLIVVAAIGKRTSESQSRRLFNTVAAERTLRAESEFLLSQQLEKKEKKAQSVGTASAFDERAAAARLEHSLTLVTEIAKREQWLIHPDEVSIHATRPLGKGGCGAVVAGTMSGLPVAVKMSIQKPDADGVRESAMLVNELRVFRKLRHPNIVMFFGAVIDTSLCEMALILELVVGPDLHKFVTRQLSAKTIMPTTTAYSLICGMSRALSYLHAQRPPIVHGDLKPPNILVENPDSGMPVAKLVDFGLSRVLAGKVLGLGGTARWMAPEQATSGRPNRAVDVYAFGKLSSFVLTGQVPFDGLSQPQVLEKLQAGDMPPPQEPPDDISPMGNFMWRMAWICAAQDASDRPDIESVSGQLACLTSTLRSDQMTPELQALGWKLWFGANEDRKMIDKYGSPTSTGWHDVIPWLRQLMRAMAGIALPAAEEVKPTQTDDPMPLTEKIAEAVEAAPDSEQAKAQAPQPEVLSSTEILDPGSGGDAAPSSQGSSSQSSGARSRPAASAVAASTHRIAL